MHQNTVALGFRDVRRLVFLRFQKTALGAGSCVFAGGLLKQSNPSHHGDWALRVARFWANFVLRGHFLIFPYGFKKVALGTGSRIFGVIF